MAVTRASAMPPTQKANSTIVIWKVPEVDGRTPASTLITMRAMYIVLLRVSSFASTVLSCTWPHSSTLALADSLRPIV